MTFQNSAKLAVVQTCKNVCVNVLQTVTPQLIANDISRNRKVGEAR
jgi:hypothetical protein